jgi:hypothetical protein
MLPEASTMTTYVTSFTAAAMDVSAGDWIEVGDAAHAALVNSNATKL